MSWFFSADDDDEDENLLFSPALMARRASESWIDTPPIEVFSIETESFYKKISDRIDEHTFLDFNFTITCTVLRSILVDFQNLALDIV